MEQRIGSSSQPLDGAGVDPAFIPGITPPVSEEPEDVEPQDTEAEEQVEEETPAEPAASEEEEREPEEEAEEEAPDGPVFEASDRRAKMVADHRGVRLSLDDQACEFRWDEIGAVETETPASASVSPSRCTLLTAAGTRSRSRRRPGAASRSGKNS